MISAKEVLRGINQFGTIEDSQSNSCNPIREATWLIKRAVEEDRALLGIDPGFLSSTKNYCLRLKEMINIFAEVFAFQEYAWKPLSENPRIIDLGGDIGGFAILYWKSIAPNARITLVEANPATVAIVTDNFSRKGMTNIEVINAAVSENGEPAELHLSGYNPSNFAGERIGLDSSSYRNIIVPGIKLSKIIGNEKVDLLKIDIEGAESGVLRELVTSGKFDLVNEIMMEFHNDPSNPNNSLQEVLGILNKVGFKIRNPHVSGIQRLKGQKVDVNLIKPTDFILFAFTASRY